MMADSNIPATIAILKAIDASMWQKLDIESISFRVFHRMADMKLLRAGLREMLKDGLLQKENHESFSLTNAGHVFLERNQE